MHLEQSEQKTLKKSACGRLQKSTGRVKWAVWTSPKILLVELSELVELSAQFGLPQNTRLVELSAQSS